MKYKKIIGTFIISLMLIGACYAAGKAVNNVLIFFDVPSIMIVIAIAWAYSFAKGKNYIEEFGNGAVYASWLGFLIGFVSMTYNISSENLVLKEIMLASSVLWLIIFYGYLIKLITRTLID